MQDEFKVSALIEVVEQWQQIGISQKQFSAERNI